MKKTLNEWLEWADDNPAYKTGEATIGRCADGEWVLVEYAKQISPDKTYDQKITLVKPRTTGSNR